MRSFRRDHWPFTCLRPSPGYEMRQPLSPMLARCLGVAVCGVGCFLIPTSIRSGSWMRHQIARCRRRFRRPVESRVFLCLFALLPSLVVIFYSAAAVVRWRGAETTNKLLLTDRRRDDAPRRRGPEAVCVGCSGRRKTVYAGWTPVVIRSSRQHVDYPVTAGIRSLGGRGGGVIVVKREIAKPMNGILRAVRGDDSVCSV